MSENKICDGEECRLWIECYGATLKDPKTGKEICPLKEALKILKEFGVPATKEGVVLLH